MKGTASVVEDGTREIRMWLRVNYERKHCRRGRQTYGSSSTQTAFWFLPRGSHHSGRPPPRPSLLPHRKAQKYHFAHALSSVYVVFSPAGPWFHEFRDPAPANLHGSPASTGLRCQVCPSSLCSIRTITPEAHRDIPASSISSTNHRPAVAHEGQDRRVVFVTPKSRPGVAGGPPGRRYSGTRLGAGTVSEQTPVRGELQTVNI